MKDLFEEEIELLEPNPASIIESLRSIGYTMETAIADLIDNSITANAKTINIDSPFEGANTKIFILDDGDGMSEEKLVEAMRLGSSSASQKRSPRDLGRFGLGLKTATFSQCKRLTVVTKHKGNIAARCWDLDRIVKTNKWCLLKYAEDEYLKRLQDMKSGTLIVWEKLDRIISEKDSKAESNFNNKKNILRRHLSLTFHRFIESGKLTINIGGQPVVSWNPFLPFKSSSLKKELPPLELNGGKVVVKGWVMPHRNYFTEQEYKDAGFRRGWTVMQGFYIYRGDRLLTAGGWLGLKPDGTAMLQEHHYDLGRISVDITNDEDFDWDIDIKKSKATPPDHLRSDLGQIAKKIRKMAYDTYSYRGNKKPHLPKKGKEYIPLWNTVQERNGKLFYSLNNNYPFVKELLDSLDKDNAAKLKKLLKLIAETIPAESIGFESSKSDSKRMSSPYEDSEEELNDIRQRLIDSFMSSGMTREEAEEQVEFTLNL
jgi:hypothetical protein